MDLKLDSKLGSIEGKLSKEIKVISFGTDSVLTYLKTSNKNMDKVYRLVQSMGETIQKTLLKITADEIKLKGVSNKVTKIREEI